jgi:hypothetical protein
MRRRHPNSDDDRHNQRSYYSLDEFDLKNTRTPGRLTWGSVREAEGN